MRQFACLFVLSLVFCPRQAPAVSPPQWIQFAKGEFVDSANIKVDGGLTAGYVKRISAGRQSTTLYEVDCKGDKVRMHSDTQRYRRVPVDGGGDVVQADDGFRTVVPDSPNARIENAICGLAAQQEADRIKKEEQAECERAKRNDFHRIFLLKDRLTQDEAFCLLELTHGDRPMECDKAGVPRNVSVVQYLHGKGIFLECENDLEGQ